MAGRKSLQLSKKRSFSGVGMSRQLDPPDWTCTLSAMFELTLPLSIVKGRSMTGISASDVVDFIEELRLRRWAREHYVPNPERNDGWHPIVLEEMSRKDEESFNEELSPNYVARV